MDWMKKIAARIASVCLLSMASLGAATLCVPVAAAQTFNASTPSAGFVGQAALLATGDLNGDGFTDQVWVGYQGGHTTQPLYLTLWLGNGDGTFGTSSGYPSSYIQVTQCASPVALATFGDATGNASIALLCYDTLQIWYPKPTSSTDSASSHQVITLDSGGAAMAVGDFTGRGLPGIAVLEYGVNDSHARSIAVYSPYSSCSSCDTSSLDTQLIPTPVTIDITNDVGANDVGHALLGFASPDSPRVNLAVATTIPGTCGGTLTTYYSSGGGGNFVHGSSVPIPAPYCATALAAGDLNGDGYPEIVVGGGKTSNTATGGTGFLSVYLGDRNAVISPLRDNAAPSLTDASVPFDSTGLAVLDMNGDGFVDIVESGTYDGVTHIYKGAGDGTFAAAQSVGTNVVTLPSGTQVNGIFSTRTASINLDGAPDLVLLDRVVDYTGSTTPEVGALYQVFTGRTGTSTTALSQGSLSTGLARTAAAAGKKGSTLQASIKRYGEGGSSLSASLQVTVTPASATGWVQFFDTTTQSWLGSAELEYGSASLSVPALGTHYVVAMYYGDSTYTGSQSSPQAIAAAKLSPNVFLQVDPSQPLPGALVTFTVNVYDTGATPGGTVSLVDTISGNTLGNLTLDSMGNGTFSTTTLRGGTYDVIANYSGDRNYNPGTSVDQFFTVGAPLVPSVVTLSASASVSASGAPVTLTAKVASSNGSGSPSGAVSFQIDGVTVGQGTISGGAASATVAAPNPGTHSVQAIYAGDSAFSAASSNTLTLTTHGAVLQFTPGSAVTVAGTPSDDLHGGFGGDGGPATSAYLHTPSGVTTDAGGNVYIADQENNVIRKVTTDGTISTVAGLPYAASIYSTTYGGDGGAATSAFLDHPVAVVLDAAGNLYIADYSNNVVRKVTAATGVISTIAGNYSLGARYNGDSGVGTSIALYHPSALALDAAGNLYIADSGNNLVRKLTSAGQISVVAGSYYLAHNGQNKSGVQATSVDLYAPMGVGVDAAGNVYISDTNNGIIRKVDTSGVITTVGGGASNAAPADNVLATSTPLNSPQQIALDLVGNLYFAEAGNGIIRKIDTSGVITTPLGYLGGSTGPWSHFDPQGQPANDFQLVVPSGVAVAPDGSLLATDTYNQTIVRSGPAGAALFGPAAVGSVSPSQIVTLSNVGDVALTFGTAAYTVTGDYTVSAGGSQPCSFAASLARGGSCTISIVYANKGGGLTGAVTFAANTTVAPMIVLKTSAAGVPTVTTLSLPGTTATKGSSLLLFATVQAQGPAPAGSVSFYDGTTLLGHGTIGSGYASLSVSTLAVGTHSLTAQYVGSGYYAASTSAAQSISITGAATTTSLTVSSSSLLSGAALTMTATVTTGSATAVTEGSVTFMDGSTALSTNTVNGSGVAQYTTSALSTGAHAITAVYQQNADFAASTSTEADVVVGSGGGGSSSYIFDYSVGVGGVPVVIHRGQTVTVGLDYTLLNNSGGAVQPSCGTLPSYATCSFNPARVILSGPITDQPVTLTITATAP